ncbi:OmpP1/FadL family transporter [Bacteroides thetaiotaomicron]|uniref:Long-chain fatty acid transport protein n=1 Tax=Bacteroides thetaiotaomicron TaxID=818 RepID=A0A174LTC4_BACT4|nr:porin [Bacteroides thetaiotaomicron]CUP26016.1 Long-chain fatty acid transport protein [Bacteroides thetaiotaomicron]
MRKNFLIGFVMLIVSIPTFAGDYLTNTNQNAAFLRMIARGASIDIDGVYSNPAGLAFLPQNGLQVALTIQSAYQTRDIAATSPLWTMDGQTSVRNYEGKASAPVIPSVHAVYKNGDWAFSGSFAIVGGGGKASFNTGLPMFDAAAIGLVNSVGQGMLMPNMYNINSAMEGRQYIYGFQLGASYKINEHFAVFAGARMNYFTGGYKGFLNIDLKDGVAEKLGTAIVEQLVAAGMTVEQAQQVALQKSQQLNDTKLELDCDQTGWGLTPIIGVDVKFGKLNLAAKYEFKANMNIENNTHELKAPDAAMGFMAPYKHGVNTPSDLPSMLSVAASYEFLPSLRASVEYHFFDDKNAGMADNKQKTLKHGTHEYLAGVEWDINKIFTVSGGYQKTDYGLSDAFQTDTSFSCDSYSVGLGGRINLSKALSLDVAYFWTTYSDYTKENPRGLGEAMASMDKDVYSRTNKVFGVSVNYKF